MTRSASTNPNVALLSTIRMWLTMAPDSIDNPSKRFADELAGDKPAFSPAAESERKALLRQIEETLGMPSTASTNG